MSGSRADAAGVALRRLSTDDWAVVVGAALVVAGTRLPWYWASFAFKGEALQVTVDGWERASYFGAVAATLCVLAALVALAKVAVRGRSWFERLAAAVATGAGGVSFLLMLWRLFDTPAGVEQRRYGIFVALAGALVVAIAGSSGLGGTTEGERPTGDETTAKATSDRAGTDR